MYQACKRPLHYSTIGGQPNLTVGVRRKWSTFEVVNPGGFNRPVEGVEGVEGVQPSTVEVVCYLQHASHPFFFTTHQVHTPFVTRRWLLLDG